MTKDEKIKMIKEKVYLMVAYKENRELGNIPSSKHTLDKIMNVSEISSNKNEPKSAFSDSSRSS